MKSRIIRENTWRFDGFYRRGKRKRKDFLLGVLASVKEHPCVADLRSSDVGRSGLDNEAFVAWLGMVPEAYEQ
jgi:hypothetical protein